MQSESGYIRPYLPPNKPFAALVSDTATTQNQKPRPSTRRSGHSVTAQDRPKSQWQGSMKNWIVASA